MAFTVRTGLIGCGKIARTHARALAGLAESEFVAVCDAVPERAAALADEHGVPHRYADAEELLASGTVDAVTVCTPHPSHAGLVSLAAGHGVHVLVEKPLSTSLAAADAMIADAARAGIRFGTVFQRRFWPAAQRVRRAIDDGRLGRPTLGESFSRLWRGPDYYAMDPWRGRWETEGGGVLMNQAVHMVDMLSWFMGPVTEVYGRWATLRHGGYVDVEDTVVATLVFESGALGVLEAATTFAPAPGFAVTVHGDSGAVVGVEETPEGTQGRNHLWTLPGDEDRLAGWDAQDRAGAGFPSFHALQIRDFLEAVHDGRDPAVTGAEGRKSLEIIRAVYRSQATGLPVRLPLAAADDDVPTQTQTVATDGADR